MKKTLLFALFICSYVLPAQSLKISDLRVEQLINPMGLDAVQPRFSWKLQSDALNTMQSAYEITVATAMDFNPKSQVWKVKVNTDQSINNAYGGKPLSSNTRYYWKVTVWDNHGNTAMSVSPAYWHTGMLNSPWLAKWISSPTVMADSIHYQSPVFKKEFNLTKTIKSAILFISSKGLYEAEINGSRVGNDYLTPGWTSYNHRIQYQVYDVTSLLKKGNNAIGATLGKGWFSGEVGWISNRNLYGKDLALIGQVMIENTDGSKQIVATDDTWKSSFGPILNSEIYHGEIYDARKELSGWSVPGNTVGNWSPVKVQSFDTNVLINTYNLPVRKREHIKPVSSLITPEGDTVIDFGQNMVGWVQVKATGKPGTTIMISHAEVLDKSGNFYIANLRNAKETNTYILKGMGEENFEPHFTFQGFRYIRVNGYPGSFDLNKFEGVALYSDMEQAGTFECSNPLINQLQHNIQWGQRGNFVDVPTDCPQRDERLGWTGDAQAFSRTAAYNFNVQNFFAKWLQDLAADQMENGAIPHVIPNALGPNAGGSTGWADASTIIPWNMYLLYGDTSIIHRQYPSMKKWVRYMEDSSVNYLWNRGFHFGDWLFYSLTDDRDGRSAVTDKYMIAQCFYAHSVQIMIDAANLLGNKLDAGYYTDLLTKVKAAFKKEYVTGSGRLISNTQTAYVLALNFDMLEEAHRADAVSRLVNNIKSYDYHITTGFLGTPYICHVLSRFGYADVAYKLLFQESYPSWLYPVKMGATTIWERWDGIKPDGTFQSASMNSFNHYAYGAIGDWMYRVVCGIETETPAYKKSIISPVLTDQLKYAKSSTITPYGLIGSGWTQSGDKITFDIEIPANTISTLILPSPEGSSIKMNGSAVPSSLQLSRKGQHYLLQVGSGKYSFEINK